MNATHKQTQTVQQMADAGTVWYELRGLSEPNGDYRDRRYSSRASAQILVDRMAACGYEPLPTIVECHYE